MVPENRHLYELVTALPPTVTSCSKLWIKFPLSKKMIRIGASWDMKQRSKSSCLCGLYDSVFQRTSPHRENIKRKTSTSSLEFAGFAHVSKSIIDFPVKHAILGFKIQLTLSKKNCPKRSGWLISSRHHMLSPQQIGEPLWSPWLVYATIEYYRIHSCAHCTPLYSNHGLFAPIGSKSLMYFPHVSAMILQYYIWVTVYLLYPSKRPISIRPSSLVKTKTKWVVKPHKPLISQLYLDVQNS